MNIVLDTDIPKEYILKPNGYFSFDVIKDNKIIYHGRLSDIYIRNIASYFYYIK